MAGFITEKHLAEAEEEFPGITALWYSFQGDNAPTTFLGLVVLWQAIMEKANGR